MASANQTMPDFPTAPEVPVRRSKALSPKEPHQADPVKTLRRYCLETGADGICVWERRNFDVNNFVCTHPSGPPFDRILNRVTSDLGSKELVEDLDGRTAFAHCTPPLGGFARILRTLF